MQGSPDSSARLPPKFVEGQEVVCFLACARGTFDGDRRRDVDRLRDITDDESLVDGVPEHDREGAVPGGSNPRPSDP